MVVGGGLGAVPRQAKVFDEFLAPEEILPLTQAMARVFGKHGEKKTRSRARLKFLIEKWGMDKFKEEVLAERGKLPPDPRWTEYLQDIEDNAEGPLRDPGELPAIAAGSALERWVRSNLRGQRQDLVLFRRRDRLGLAGIRRSGRHPAQRRPTPGRPAAANPWNHGRRF